jgi:hypothetical protein|tara:strand:- start:1749 stop:2399 length:651 start_codon:yes stop_codon:yes gene_type:complete
MEIKYKIIKSTPDEHSVVVRFYTDTISEEALAIRDAGTGEILLKEDGTIQSCRTDYNITLWDTPTLTGEALEKVIMRHAPTKWFELLGKVSDASVDTSLSGVTLNTISTKTHTSAPAPDATALQRQEIEATFGSEVVAIKAGYTGHEILSWDQKYREALIVKSGESSPTPMLDSIAAASGTTVEALADKIISKATAFATAYGAAEAKMKLAIAALG